MCTVHCTVHSNFHIFLEEIEDAFEMGEVFKYDHVMSFSCHGSTRPDRSETDLPTAISILDLGKISWLKRPEQSYRQGTTIPNMAIVEWGIVVASLDTNIFST